MKSAPFRLEPLSREHHREAFHCGEDSLDRYFRTQATQDIRRRMANCFVAVEALSGEIAGYYTIAAASISFVDLPSELAKRLPRYPTLPAVRIGRLAVDTRFQGRGLGAALPADAARRIGERRRHRVPAVKDDASVRLAPRPRPAMLRPPPKLPAAAKSSLLRMGHLASPDFILLACLLQRRLSPTSAE